MIGNGRRSDSKINKFTLYCEAFQYLHYKINSEHCDGVLPQRRFDQFPESSDGEALKRGYYLENGDSDDDWIEGSA